MEKTDGKKRDEIILVDFRNHEIGVGEKMHVHRMGYLHRAFSIFIIDKKGRMLIQKRNNNKYHSGGLWANACCSHPRKGENIEDAVKRRMQEEIGLFCEINYIFDFIYNENYGDLSEYEYDHVFLGICDQEKIIFDENEIEECMWIEYEKLEAWMLKKPSEFASWFIIACPKVLSIIEQRYIAKIGVE